MVLPFSGCVKQSHKLLFVSVIGNKYINRSFFYQKNSFFCDQSIETHNSHSCELHFALEIIEL